MLIPTAVSAEFFHTTEGTAFVDLLINGNRETWPKIKPYKPREAA